MSKSKTSKTRQQPNATTKPVSKGRFETNSVVHCPRKLKPEEIKLILKALPEPTCRFYKLTREDILRRYGLDKQFK